jgi:hypothetical protein
VGALLVPLVALGTRFIEWPPPLSLDSSNFIGVQVTLMKSNEVLRKLRGGESTLGCFVGLGSPSVVELLGHAGLDWLILETEHNGLDAAEVEHLLRAAGVAAFRKRRG